MDGVPTSWQGLSVLEHLPQPFVLVDAQGTILRTNPVAQALLGEPAQAMQGQPVSRFLPRPERGEAAPAWRPCDGGVLLARHHDGLEFPVEVLGTRFAVDGQPVCALLLRDLRAVRVAKAHLGQWEELFLYAGWGVAVSAVPGNTLELMNPAFARMHGRRVAELLGRPLLEVFAPSVRAEVQEQVRRGDAMGRYRYESVHVRKDGSEFPVLIDVTVVRDAEGQARYRVVNVQDISELRRGEEAVRRAKRFFEAIFESAAMGMAVLAADGRVLRVNSALCGLLGCAPAALLGADLRERLGDESRTAFGAALQRVCADAGSGVERLEASMHGDGRRALWAALALSRVPARNGEETQVIVQAVDITERRQAELALGESRQELRALAAYDDALIEEERKHIAREVHDELGQLLTALRMDLALLRPAVQGEAAQAQVEKMREMIDHTIMVVRHVASNLRPAALDLGLVAALEWLTEDFSLRWEMPCELQLRGEGFQLDEAVATALFRVVQESLTNVARHAHAGRVAVRLARDARDLVLEVEDDGQGFDPRALRSRKRKGFGLLGMEERMLKIGGTLEVQSGPWGTRVRLQLPMAAATTTTTP